MVISSIEDVEKYRTKFQIILLIQKKLQTQNEFISYQKNAATMGDDEIFYQKRLTTILWVLAYLLCKVLK